MGWLYHPSGKIAVYVKDPVYTQSADEVIQDEKKRNPKKK